MAEEESGLESRRRDMMPIEAGQEEWESNSGYFY